MKEQQQNVMYRSFEIVSYNDLHGKEYKFRVVRRLTSTHLLFCQRQIKSVSLTMLTVWTYCLPVGLSIAILYIL